MRYNYVIQVILTAFLLTVTFFDFAQTFDDFSDGEFMTNPAWFGETSVFEVDVNYRLHLNGPAITDTSYLVVPSSLANHVEWTFLVTLDFNPSSSNLARVFLMADQPNLEQNINGYFVQVGGSGDEVSLYKQSGTNITEIIDGADDSVDSNPAVVRVKVTRTNNGLWSLSIDNTGGTTYISQGSVIDSDFTQTSYLGVFCKYTSTRSDKFYFDDFTISPMPIVDTVPPQLVNVSPVSNQILYVSFSENINELTAEITNNYSVNHGLGSPSQAELIDTNHRFVKLTFPTVFQEGLEYVLSVENIADDSNNIMPISVANFIYLEPFLGEYKDIVITELMIDPSPAVGIPETEYLELFNNTNQVISLEGWTISDGNTTMIFSNELFPPQTYLLCYKEEPGIDFGIPNSIGALLPAMNNSGDIITLIDANGKLIDSVSYNLNWYQNSSKSEGGWSLELKNIDSPCHDPNNWSSSENVAGGTPGSENSIYSNAPDTLRPEIKTVFIENDTVIHFVFSEIVSLGKLSVEPVLDALINLSESELEVKLSDCQKNQVYHITISDFADCWGNQMKDYIYAFAIPEAAAIGDVLINEILFNPIDGGKDYLEIVNVSDKILSLDQLQLADVKQGEVSDVAAISDDRTLFLPGDYLLLTEDSLVIIETFSNYSPGRFHQVNLPSYNNDMGDVIIMRNDSVRIDQFSYHEEMHFALIDDLNGKALERMSFSLPTQSNDNWHTASESSGWGTPGFENSQKLKVSPESEVQLSKAIFSPDNDGYQDVLEIEYQFDTPDNVMDIVVYNSDGQPIRILKDNFFPGQKGSVIWDGTTDEGTKAYVGAYIVGVTVFNLDGDIKQYKLVGVLATKL